MKWICYFSFILSLQLPAFEVVRRDSKIILHAPTCNQVKEITESLMKWTKSIQENKICPPFSQMRETEQGNCEFDITECVPSEVAKYQSVTSKFNGPNCWNSALVMKGILPNLRYTSPEEMSFYMRPPLCKQLKNNEQKMPGDVGAIRSISNNQAEENHGFIYISDKIVYSKSSIYKESPYTLQSSEDMYNDNETPMKPECNSDGPSYSTECPNIVSFFRCISMKKYLSENPDLPSQILNKLKNFNEIEGCLESRAMSGKKFSTPVLEVIKSSTQTLAFYLQEEFKKNNTTDANEQDKRNFLLGSLQLRLNAIMEQLPGGSLESNLASNTIYRN